MRKTIPGSLKARGLSVVYLLAVGVVGFSAVAAADTVGSIDFEYLRARRHQRPERLVEDRPLRRQRSRDAAALRLRKGAAHLERGHERQLRRPDLLARPRRRRPGSPAQSTSRRASRSARRRTTCSRACAMSVSPDNGSGGRMSYLRFEDQTDGVHVFFNDVTNPGPLGTRRLRMRRTSPRSTGRAPTRSGSRSTSRPARPTTASRSTSTATLEGHRHDLGGLLPLRRGADRQRNASRPSARCCSARAATALPPTSVTAS